MRTATAAATPPKSLVIVGAGMSGIKLAHYCLEHDPTMDLTILEANDYVGGRMRCFDFEGHTVEMGANWISGLEGVYVNPVWRLARELDPPLDGHLSDRGEDRAVHATDWQGNDVNEAYIESMKRFDETYEKAVRTCAERRIEPRNDVDVKSLLHELGWEQDKLSDIDRSVQCNFLEAWVADDLGRLSAAHELREGANDMDLGKEEFFVEDRRGFNSILRGMVDDIGKRGGKVKLGTQVQVVRYVPGDVGVTARDLQTGEVAEYTADAVVSTVSLGVLQSDAIEFSPPLPDWKMTALKELEMFVFAKVYVKFDSKCWPTDKAQLIICGKKKGRYPLWMRYRNSKDNLFMCYLGGREARRVESLTTDQIKDEVEEVFRNAYESVLGDGVDSGCFRPSAVAVTNWSKNPRFCGSYSFFPVNAFKRIPRSDLTRSLTGTTEKNGPTTLYFAGEGFDDLFNGWVQGAYRSGERVAKSIFGHNE